MKSLQTPLLLTLIVWITQAWAQLSFVNTQPVETDSQGHVIEKLDYDRKITTKGKEMVSSKDYRDELAERERMRKVAAKVGPWFDSIQRLEVDQAEAEKKHGVNGGGLAGDGVDMKDSSPGQSGAGMAAYIEAMRVFNTNLEMGGNGERDAKQLLAALEELLYRRKGEVLCGPGHGTSIKYPLEHLLVRYQSRKAQSLPMDELYAAKSADLWPGKVPADAERVTKTVVLYPGEGGWLSTGLYVPPGEIVTLKTSSLNGNLIARIGCHSDKLDPQIVPLDEDGKPLKDEVPNMAKVKMGWEQATDMRPLWRWPDMVRNFNVTKKKQEIGHVLGGVLWFQWSGGNSPLKIEVSGCVQMPWFRLGLDTNEDWVNTISKYPAPWAEIETKLLILTVQSHFVRNIKNIEALAQWWGKAAAIMLRVAGHSLPTDSEARNYRENKREWAIKDKALIRLNEAFPLDAEEQFRLYYTPPPPKMENPNTTTLSEEALAEQKAAEEAFEKARAEHNKKYGFEEQPLSTQPVHDYGEVRSITKMTREKDGKAGTRFRLVDDTQISIGAGHSGYPIMCCIWGGSMTNLKQLQKTGAWGALHEMGHNMGQGANGIFALPGNIEVVCNFFGVCVMHLLNGTPFPYIRPELWENAQKSINGGEREVWKNGDAGVRLVFYMALVHYFGVESAITIVNDRSDKYPTAAVGDRMCCAWSKAVKRDLTPYFEMWGLPLSKATYTFTQDWAPWPTNDEKQSILITPTSKSRYDTGNVILEISDPDAVKTRRQLRDRAYLDKVLQQR